jgi:hypothetical protein
MKKLYFLDEEEKNRILNLHESATKRQYLSEQTKPTQAELDKREARWKTDLKCVPIQPGAKKIDRQDKTTAYQIGDIIYYNTGRKKLKDGTMTNYSCTTEFKTGVSTEDKAKKVQQYRQQIITKTSDITKQIQKLLGINPETGVMDSGLLQKINDKLNGGGTSSAPAAETGTTASATGTTASATGTTASATGTTASATGTTADETGTTAAATGTTATSATTQSELSQTSQQALSGQLTPQQIRQQSRFDQRLARQARRNERRAGNN